MFLHARVNVKENKREIESKTEKLTRQIDNFKKRDASVYPAAKLRVSWKRMIIEQFATDSIGNKTKIETAREREKMGKRERKGDWYNSVWKRERKREKECV